MSAEKRLCAVFVEAAPGGVNEPIDYGDEDFVGVNQVRSRRISSLKPCTGGTRTQSLGR